MEYRPVPIKIMHSSVVLILLSLLACAFDKNSNIYEPAQLLKECKAESAACWAVISSVISTRKHLVVRKEDRKETFCLPWDISYSYGKETDKSLKKELTNAVISYIEKERAAQGQEPYNHQPTAADAIIFALRERYPCGNE